MRQQEKRKLIKKINEIPNEFTGSSLLVEHSLSELEKMSEHHNFDSETVEPEMLYLFTKIERIKARLSPPVG